MTTSTPHRVLAYSLFATRASPHAPLTLSCRYTVGLLETLQSRDKYFPDWWIYVYLDESIFQLHHHALSYALSHTPKLKCIHLPPHFMHFPTYMRAGYRFQALQEGEDVEVVLFRDVDSPLTARDALEVQAWLEGSDSIILRYRSLFLDVTQCKYNHTQFIHDISRYPEVQWERDEDFPAFCHLKQHVEEFAAGGTAVHLGRWRSGYKKTPPVSYLSFLRQCVDSPRQGDQGDCRGFDETYLGAIFASRKVSIRTIPMFIVSAGIIEARWYAAEDFRDEPDLYSRLTWDTEPLLDFDSTSRALQQLREKRRRGVQFSAAEEQQTRLVSPLLKARKRGRKKIQAEEIQTRKKARECLIQKQGENIQEITLFLRLLVVITKTLEGKIVLRLTISEQENEAPRD